MTANAPVAIVKELPHALSQPGKFRAAPEYAVGRLLEAHGDIGSWRFVLATETFHFSQSASRLAGLSPAAEGMALKPVFAMFIADDRAAAARLLTDPIRNRSGAKAQLRIVTPDNQVRRLEFICDVELNAKGDPIGIIGIVRDVTALEHLSRSAASKAGTLRALMSKIPMAIAILDDKLRYIAVSDAWAAGHGDLSPAELQGACHYDVHQIPDDAKREHHQVLSGITLVRKRNYLRDSNGDPITQDCVMTPWFVRKDEVGGMIIMLKHIDPENTLATVDGTDHPQMSEFDRLLAEMN